MVAGHGHVVAHLVHDVDDVFALGQRAHGRALYGVAAVHQRQVVAGGLIGGLVGGQSGIADGIVNAAVYVVGVEYHSGGILGGFFLGEGAEAQKHRRRQQDGQQFFGHG